MGEAQQQAAEVAEALQAEVAALMAANRDDVSSKDGDDSGGDDDDEVPVKAFGRAGSGADDGAGADAFASVLISHGVHSLRSPFFRDATGGVRRLSRALANHSFAAKFAQKLKEGTGESLPAPSSPPRRDGSMPRRPPRAR